MEAMVSSAMNITFLNTIFLRFFLPSFLSLGEFLRIIIYFANALANLVRRCHRVASFCVVRVIQAY